MTYVAAVMIVAAVALFVAAPLTEGVRRRRPTDADALQIERIDHERALAMQGLRELEFDHEMGKVDAADYHSLRASLENRALAAMTALDQARRQKLERPRIGSAAPLASPSPEPPRRANFCPQCGTRPAAGNNFCGECGASLAPGQRAAAQAQ